VVPKRAKPALGFEAMEAQNAYTAHDTPVVLTENKVRVANHSRRASCLKLVANAAKDRSAHEACDDTDVKAP
jgi:hypothetical protein